MKSEEILEMEKHNYTTIILVLEGNFFCAYEQSAMRFVKHLHDYKIHCRYVKKVMEHIVYLGFPQSIIGEIQKQVEEDGFRWNVIEPNKKIEIAGFYKTNDFKDWKDSIINNSENLKAVKIEKQQTSLNLQDAPFKATSVFENKNVESKVAQNVPPKNATGGSKNVPIKNYFVAYREAYDFAMYICHTTSKFHRSFRFGFGDKLREQCILFLEHLQLVVCSVKPFDREYCISLLLRMRIELRLCYDLKQMANRQWIFANEKIEKVIKLLRLESFNSRIEGESPLEPRDTLENEFKA